MRVIDRIRPGPACNVIDLSECEKDIYSGAGLRMARFVGGVLKELFDPFDQVSATNDMDDEGRTAILAVLYWASEAEGEIYSVMCSCYQLCDPKPFQHLNTDSVALLGTRIFSNLQAQENDFCS